MLRGILYGLSCRDDRIAAEAVPDAFGLSRSSISRRYIRATARQLAALQERRLERYDRVALVLDGTRFAAARSLTEGLEETLTLHRLGLADRLGTSLLTTNGLESILALVEQRVGKVDRWTTSDQKHRWLATSLLEIEPRLRRLRGYRALPQLRTALRQTTTQEEEVMVA